MENENNGNEESVLRDTGVTGTWDEIIVYYDDVPFVCYRCSQCAMTYDSVLGYNYCPNCGSRNRINPINNNDGENK